MKLVTATDLDHWADRREAQGELPRLVQKLILASADEIGFLGMPAGDSIYLPGWDGNLDAGKGEWPVPAGISAWELSAETDVLGKVRKDLKKRTNETLGVDPAQSTFVFVTPRRWTRKKQSKIEWAADQKQKSPWRKVIIVDGDDLEAWIDRCAAVGAWFATYIGRQPEGVEALETYWRRVVSDTDPELTPEIVLAGRDDFSIDLLEWAEGDSPTVRIKADTQEEAILLPAAWAQAEGGIAEGLLFANAIVVHTEEAWRQVVVLDRPQILIPAFTGGSLGLGDLEKKGHWIMIPSGWDAGEKESMIVAGPLEREKLKTALAEVGVPESEAEKIADNSGRSLPVVIRRLSRTPERRSPAWAEPSEAILLIPILLIGRWDRYKEGDRVVVAEIADKPYNEVEIDISRWLDAPDSPVRLIGNTFILTSPLDAWSVLGRHIPKQIWDRYTKVLLELLIQRDPALDLEQEQRWAAAIHGKSRAESDGLRSGLVEQLARLVGAEGRFHQGLSPDPSSVAKLVLSECLSGDHGLDQWLSINSQLPDLAEAAPGVFLDRLEALLSDNDAASALFETKTDAFLGTSPHVFLMWAIERIRWFRPHLRRCAEALVALAKLDPGSNSMPRPSSTFAETFHLSDPENCATFSDQLTIIREVSDADPAGAWPLLLELLPHSTWRTVKSGPVYHHADPPDRPPTFGELWSRIESILDILINLAGQKVDRWVDLMGRFPDLHPRARKSFVVSLEAFVRQLVGVDRSGLAMFHRMEGVIRHHMRFPDAEWSLPSEELEEVGRISELLRPSDPVEIHKWLFSSPWLDLPRDDAAGKHFRAHRAAGDDIFLGRFTHGAGVLIFVDDGVADEQHLHVGDAIDGVHHLGQRAPHSQAIEEILNLGIEQAEVIVDQLGR